MKKALFPDPPKSFSAAKTQFAQATMATTEQSKTAPLEQPLQPSAKPPQIKTTVTAEVSKPTPPLSVSTKAAPPVPSSAGSSSKTPGTSASPVTPVAPVSPITPITPTASGISSGTAIIPQKSTVLEIISINGKLNPRTGKVDVANGEIERTIGVLNPKTGFIKTKYGELNPKTRELRTNPDPKTGKSTTKAVAVDAVTGQVAISGAVNPKNSKIDNSLGHLISFGSEIEDPVVEVAAISGKYDTRKNIIDPKTATVSCSLGSLDTDTDIISTTYGEINLKTSKITWKNPKTQKLEMKDIKFDPTTGQVIIRNEVNPRTNKAEKDYGRIISLRIVNRRLDPKSGRIDTPLTATNDIVVDPVSNRIWVPQCVNPNTNEITYTSSQVDQHGVISVCIGFLNPLSNVVEKQTGVETKTTKVDPASGQIFVATGDHDENGQPFFATSQVDEESGEIYTKLAKVDATGKIILIKIILITKKDASGVPQEVEAKNLEIDASGRVQNIFNKTVYVYNMVDPVSGEVIQVDPSDPRVAGARTTVTQTLTLTGKIDEVSGFIKTEYGDINPETGDITPETAVRDPITGKLILNYAQIDPSHFGKEVTVEKESTPITRDQFFDGIAHLGSSVVRHPSEGEEEDLAQYIDSSKVTLGQGKYNAPKVVKTTTKQVITKNDDGVTHNVEEEIRNLGTGEVVFNTQEHKVCSYGIRKVAAILSNSKKTFFHSILSYFVYFQHSHKKIVIAHIVIVHSHAMI